MRTNVKDYNPFCVHLDVARFDSCFRFNWIRSRKEKSRARVKRVLHGDAQFTMVIAHMFDRKLAN